MYRFPATNIVLTEDEKYIIKKVNNIYDKYYELNEIKNALKKLDQNIIEKLYHNFHLKKYNGVYYDPNYIEDIIYAIYIDTEKIKITIPYYEDNENNKYEFDEVTGWLKRIIKSNGETVRFMYSKYGQIVNKITNNNHFIYIHSNDKYTEIYDKNQVKKTREVIEPSIRDIRFNISYCKKEYGVKPHYIQKDNNIIKLFNYFKKQNIKEDILLNIIKTNTNKHILLNIPKFEKNNFLSVIERLKISHTRLTPETNEYKCRKCGQIFSYHIDRKKIRCPNCQFINIILNY